MDILTVVLIVLVVAAIWAVAELALTMRRARSSADNLDKTISALNDTVAEARPAISKLDGVIDDLGPVVKKLDPLADQASVAVEALTNDLIEINGALRNVSDVTGAAAGTATAISGVAESASGAVSRLLNRRSGEPKALEHTAKPEEALEPAEAAGEEPAPAGKHYFTYSDDAPAAPAASAADEAPADDAPAAHE